MPSFSTSASLRLARSGSSRSSRNRSTNSSRLRTNRNASSLSPSPGPPAFPPLWPERGSMSPSMNFLFPGSTISRVPPSRRKRGSSIPSIGMLTSPPSRTSLMSRSCEDFFTAPCTSALALRRKRWRFSRPLAAWIQAPIDDMNGHFRIRLRLNRPASPACTTRRAAGPDAQCSRVRPSARQTRRASFRYRHPFSTRTRSPEAGLRLARRFASR